ncbi:MAG: hypothetical protein WCJ74_01025 [bacterium]
MNTISLNNNSVKNNVLKKPKVVDFSAILAVYKSSEGCWKGFAFPYDVMTQANTKTLALKQLRVLVKVYTDELKKYDFPPHLVHVPLTDLEDREVFARVLDDKIDQKKIIDQQDYHAETYKIRS